MFNRKYTFYLIFFIYSSCFSHMNVGQRFIFTLPDIATEKMKSWLEKTKPAGVMLMDNHFKNRLQTKELIKFLQKTAKQIGIPELFIAVDWEGGIVSRPKEQVGFVLVPSPRNLCLAGRNYAYLAGKLIGQQMRLVGANMNFAPTFDLFDPQNEVLATRCFSNDPLKTSEFGITFAKGMMSEGILPVAKHFPGLGLGKFDTHQKRVEINLDNASFEKHLLPFKKALQEIPCVMSSHAQYSFFGHESASLNANVV